MEGDVVWNLKWTSNFPLHNMVYTKPIITMQGNHSYVTKVIPTNFVIMKFVVAKFYVDVNVHLTTRIPSHNIITTKPVPLDPRRDPLEPTKGVVVTFVQPVKLYFRSYMRLLNYLKYKKIK
jgi:hypothetical protein